MKKCNICSSDNPDQALFCSTCGQPMEAAPSFPAAPAPANDGFTAVPPPAYSDVNQPAYPTANSYGTPLRDGKKGFAIASLICGIFSVACCVSVGFGFIAGVLGVVFGILGLKSTTKRGLALAGLILGAFGVVLGIIMLVTVVVQMSDPAFWEEYKDMLEDIGGIQI